jgi:anti-anti-sigma factor
VGGKGTRAGLPPLKTPAKIRLERETSVEDEIMRVTFWGVRGSIPAPLRAKEIEIKLAAALMGAQEVDLNDVRAVQAYVAGLPPLVRGTVGGNTPCVSIEVGDQWIILDAGSGLRDLGEELVQREFGRGEGVAHILISHTHWDHIQGFPFFRPTFVRGNRITIYSPIPKIEQRIRNQQVPEYFPKQVDQIARADLSFVQLQENRPVTIAGVEVNSILQSHPGQSYGYRLDGKGASIVYASDAEYKKLGEAHTQRYIDFMRDADLLIFDAQYTLSDSFQREDWGHSSSIIGVDMAVRANVKRLSLFHFEHIYTDRQVRAILDDTLSYIASDPTKPQCQVNLSIEGMTIDLGAKDQIQLRQRQVGASAVLSIGGRFDATAVTQVDERLAALISDGLEAGVVVDLSETTHLAVAGLKTLLNAQQMGQGVPLVLAAAPENVTTVLAQIGFAEAFEQYDTVSDALSALQARRYLQLQGQLLHGRYRLDKALDISDQAGLFKAFDTWIERPVTIKVLSKSVSEQADQILLNEARALARLDHPNIVAVYDCFEHRDHLYLVREYVGGQSVRRWLAELDPDTFAPTAQAARIATGILEGLAYAHKRAIVHRHIQPKNIILSGVRVKIMNFGLADPPSEDWTDEDIVYMPPEQLMAQESTASSDLYALGVLVYEMLTRQMPFKAKTSAELIEQCVSAPPRPPSTHNPDIPPQMEDLILALLAKDAENRPQTVKKVLPRLAKGWALLRDLQAVR